MRLTKIRLMVATLMLIGLVGAVCGLYIHHNNTKHLQTALSLDQSTGGISIGTPSTSSISIGNEAPQPAELLKQINNSRATNGQSPVTENALLDKSAQLKLDDMIAKNYWGHVAPDGIQWSSFIQQVGYVYSAAGENLAYGQYKYYPNKRLYRSGLIARSIEQTFLASNIRILALLYKKQIVLTARLMYT